MGLSESKVDNKTKGPMLLLLHLRVTGSAGASSQQQQHGISDDLPLEL
jgi:hypothetical protein